MVLCLNNVTINASLTSQLIEKEEYVWNSMRF